MTLIFPFCDCILIYLFDQYWYLLSLSQTCFDYNVNICLVLRQEKRFNFMNFRLRFPSVLNIILSSRISDNGVFGCLSLFKVDNYSSYNSFNNSDRKVYYAINLRNVKFVIKISLFSNYCSERNK